MIEEALDSCLYLRNQKPEQFNIVLSLHVDWSHIDAKAEKDSLFHEGKF